MAATIGADGFHLLRAARDPQAPVAVRTAPALDILRQVWVQQYYGPEEPVCWRASGDVPPAECLIHSPYDSEARYSSKRGMPWLGYTVHLTETGDEDTPQLITQVETTAATVQDDAVTARIQDDLAARGIVPTVHLVDAGYTTAGHLVTSRDEHGIDLVGPVAASAGWQARAGNGFDLAHFVLDWDNRTALCPQGKRSRPWEEGETPAGRQQITVRFHAGDCRTCVCREACTRRKTAPRALTLLPRAEYEALLAARLRQEPPLYKEVYARRAGIEGTLAQGIRVSDLRHSRYLGLARTHLQQIIIAVALNLLRTLAWLHDVPRAVMAHYPSGASMPPPVVAKPRERVDFGVAERPASSPLVRVDSAKDTVGIPWPLPSAAAGARCRVASRARCTPPGEAAVAAACDRYRC